MKRLRGNPIDLTGHVYGRLTVLRLSDKMRGPKRCWVCECSCGSIVVKAGNDLRNGDAKSCGCLHDERAAKMGAANRRHGETSLRDNTPEYRTWVGMRKRCRDKRDKNYGGRGISVCPQWDQSYETFLLCMGRKPTSKHSIDRINVNGNYEPENCRWATAAQQSNNKRPRAKAARG